MSAKPALLIVGRCRCVPTLHRSHRRSPRPMIRLLFTRRHYGCRASSRREIDQRRTTPGPAFTTSSPAPALSRGNFEGALGDPAILQRGKQALLCRARRRRPNCCGTPASVSSRGEQPPPATLPRGPVVKHTQPRNRSACSPSTSIRPAVPSLSASSPCGRRPHNHQGRRWPRAADSSVELAQKLRSAANWPTFVVVSGPLGQRNFRIGHRSCSRQQAALARRAWRGP